MPKDSWIARSSVLASQLIRSSRAVAEVKTRYWVGAVSGLWPSRRVGRIKPHQGCAQWFALLWIVPPAVACELRQQRGIGVAFLSKLSREPAPKARHRRQCRKPLELRKFRLQLLDHLRDQEVAERVRDVVGGASNASAIALCRGPDVCGADHSERTLPEADHHFLIDGREVRRAAIASRENCFRKRRRSPFRRAKTASKRRSMRPRSRVPYSGNCGPP